MMGVLLALQAACAPAAPPAPRAGSAPAAPAQPAAPPAAPAPQPPPAQPAAAAPAPSLMRFVSGHQGLTPDGPIYIALERGYFREEGLDVELALFNSGADQIAGLASGQLLVGVGAISVGLFNAVVRGVPIRIVANKAFFPPDYRGYGWMVRKDLLDSGRVREPSDLRGLTIGMGARGTAVETQLDVLLRRGGLTTEDVELKQISYADMAAALSNRSIDVGYSLEPFTSNIQELDLARMWMATGELIPNHDGAVILYSPTLVESHADAGRGWMVAYLRGVRDFIKAFEQMSPPDDVLAAMVKHGNEKDPAKILRTRPGPVNPDGYNFKTSLQTDLDYFVRAGHISSPPDLNAVVDSSFVDYAISRLGRYQP